ncbi:pilus assembly protein TadG-related protein [Thermomicrobiaceae bacterium CFH 74404]|uniref:Pilus assembly protein TadG-related protein n=2 Tax=Thermalbibacter longus TaxID=2951981 RepID=A0AA42BA95_9BACT|nr:pilus assembly protein TadG-related protein [Thermalbibacter longus]
MAVVLFGFLGLAVDAGYLISERRRAQNAADAVALAAARLIAQGKSTDVATAAAVAVVAPSDDYPDGFPSTEIAVVYEPSETSPDRVIATVQHEVQPFFIRALYTGEWAVSAEAVARYASQTGPFALLALAEGNNCNAPNTGIRFQGSGTVVIHNGSIGSNNCIRVSGANNLTVDVNGGNAEAVREVVYNGGAEIEVDGGYSVHGAIPPIPNPLAGLTPPACTSLTTNPAPLPDPQFPGNNDYVILKPGRYTNFPSNGYKGISLLPGVYCFEKRITVKSNGFIRSVDASYSSGTAPGALPAGGVVIYLTGSQGELRLNGGAKLQLQAAGAAPSLTCSALNGINSGLCDEKVVIWIANSNSLTLNGHVENELVGTIYAPNASVTLAGTSDTPVLTGRVIARDITITGDAVLNLEADPESTADPSRVYLIK